MNVQFAVKDEDVYVLEVNPRASRTVPFVSKAIGVPLAKLAAKVMAGKTLRELGFTSEIVPTHYSVKEAVFPFLRFEGVNISLGPEMKSTGEVMGIDADLGLAFAKSQMAAPAAAAERRQRFHQCERQSTKKRHRVAREYRRARFRNHRHLGHGRTPCRRRHRGDESVQDLREGRPNVLDRDQERATSSSSSIRRAAKSRARTK